MRYKKIIVNIVSLSIITFIFYILIKNLYLNIDKLVQYELKFTYYNLIVAIILRLLSYLPIPLMWCIILKSLNVNLSYKNSFKIQYISQLGVYLPGKIWAQIAQVYLAKKEQIPIKITLISNVLLLIISTIGNIYVFLISFFLWLNYTLSFKILILLSTTIISYSIFKTGLLEKVINFILKNFFKKDLQMRLIYHNLISLYLLFSLSWIIFGIGYFFMINAFFHINIKECIIIVGIYSISYLIGYYTIIFPGGLGIREGVQVYLLNQFFPLPISIMIALVSRIWMSVAEGLISLIALWLARCSSNRDGTVK